jgi:hypothetical protein
MIVIFKLLKGLKLLSKTYVHKKFNNTIQR